MYEKMTEHKNKSFSWEKFFMAFAMSLGIITVFVVLKLVGLFN